MFNKKGILEGRKIEKETNHSIWKRNLVCWLKGVIGKDIFWWGYPGKNWKYWIVSGILDNKYFLLEHLKLGFI